MYLQVLLCLTPLCALCCGCGCCVSPKGAYTGTGLSAESWLPKKEADSWRTQMLSLKFLVVQSAGNCSEWAENSPGCFSLKCMNFISKAEEIFACCLLLPPLFLIFVQQSWVLDTIPALWRGTESYTGNARYWDISLFLHSMWKMVYYNKFVSTSKLVQWTS